MCFVGAPHAYLMFVGLLLFVSSSSSSSSWLCCGCAYCLCVSLCGIFCVVLQGMNLIDIFEKKKSTGATLTNTSQLEEDRHIVPLLRLIAQQACGDYSAVLRVYQFCRDHEIELSLSLDDSWSTVEDVV
jgi:hypothetical protein